MKTILQHSKKMIFIGGLASLAVMVLSARTQATSYQFKPGPVALNNLPHEYYYAWGIKWTGPSLSGPEAEKITSVSLNITKINNWQFEPDDVLHIWLLDSLPTNIKWKQKNWPGISYGLDNQTNNDPFVNSGGTFLMNYTDQDERRAEDLVISIPADVLAQYISNDGIFGIALDPDCHYYNKGISLTIDTVPAPDPNGAVPEPVTMAGFFCGLSVLAGYWRKRKQV